MREERKTVQMHPLALVFMAVALGSVGQVSMKHGVSAAQITIGAFGPQAFLNAFRAIFTPYVFLGFVLYGISSLIWLMVLKTQELSYIYPMIAVGYVVVVFLSWFFFGDRIGWDRMAGVALICAGVVLVARS
jgi:uncharacterized membrane protein